MSVDYCSNSTITEAWAVLYGLPGPIDDTDAAAILRTAREEIGDLASRPAVIAVQSENKELMPPFWHHQHAWEGSLYLVRFGHRYLSVHFLRQGGPYTRYEEILRPWVNRWLQIYARALGKSASGQGIDRVGFGYVNTFEFDPNGFDLSRYFKLNVAVDLAGPKVALLGLDTSFRTYDPDSQYYGSINLTAESPSDAPSPIRIVTKVVSERRGVEGTSFADSAKLSDMIMLAKQDAKESFFRLATPETHTLMGAVTAPDAATNP